jgi:hypothetical protein
MPTRPQMAHVACAPSCACHARPYQPPAALRQADAGTPLSPPPAALFAGLAYGLTRVFFVLPLR